jgi:hypothetical protein
MHCISYVYLLPKAHGKSLFNDTLLTLELFCFFSKYSGLFIKLKKEKDREKKKKECDTLAQVLIFVTKGK